MKRLAVILALTPLFVVACAGTGAKAPEGKPLAVINLTAGPEDAHRAWMALRLAEHFLAYGRDVVVFMNVKALLAGGAKILVCQECAAKTGVTATDLVPGVVFADRDSLFGGLDARTVVFSY